MTIGPLSKVDTIIGGINNDVKRLLRLGTNLLEFIKPDADEISGWVVIKEVTKGYYRPKPNGELSEDAKDVIFSVTNYEDDELSLSEVVRIKDIHIRHDGEIYKVAHAPDPEPTEAQIYRIVCGQRIAKNTYFQNR